MTDRTTELINYFNTFTLHSNICRLHSNSPDHIIVNSWNIRVARGAGAILTKGVDYSLDRLVFKRINGLKHLIEVKDAIPELEFTDSEIETAIEESKSDPTQERRYLEGGALHFRVDGDKFGWWERVYQPFISEVPRWFRGYQQFCTTYSREPVVIRDLKNTPVLQKLRYEDAIQRNVSTIEGYFTRHYASPLSLESAEHVQILVEKDILPFLPQGSKIISVNTTLVICAVEMEVPGTTLCKAVKRKEDKYGFSIREQWSENEFSNLCFVAYAGKAYALQIDIPGTVLKEGLIFFAPFEVFKEEVKKINPVIGGSLEAWGDLIFISSSWCQHSDLENPNSYNRKGIHAGPLLPKKTLLSHIYQMIGNTNLTASSDAFKVKRNIIIPAEKFNEFASRT